MKIMHPVGLRHSVSKHTSIKATGTNHRRDLYICQKSPIAKETYIHLFQKRPINIYVNRERDVYAYVKRDQKICPKKTIG